MLNCPRCGVELARTDADGGMVHDCPRCGGRMAGIGVLRKDQSTKPLANEIWRLARAGQGSPGAPCAQCGRAMLAVATRSGLSAEVCVMCSAAWMDGADAPAPAAPQAAAEVAAVAAPPAARGGAAPQPAPTGGQLRVGCYKGLTDEARGRAVAAQLARFVKGSQAALVLVEPGEPVPGESCVFASALDVALLNGEVDLAVQGLQEMACGVPAGLKLAAVTQRIDCRDAAVTTTQLPLVAMPEGTQVVVDGPRRALQVKRLRADLEPIVLLTRPHALVASVSSGDDQAGVVGLGELRWMGAEANAAEIFSVDDMMPPPGQGALALVVRDGDQNVEQVALTVHHKATWTCVRTERALFAAFGWNGYSPAGAVAEIRERSFTWKRPRSGPKRGRSPAPRARATRNARPTWRTPSPRS